MKKQKRMVVILAIIVVIVAAAFIIAMAVQNNQNKKEKETQNDLKLLSFDEDSLTKIKLTALDGEKYELENNGSAQWKLTNRKDIVIDSAYGNTVASYLSNLTADKNLGSHEDDPKDFGLDNPVTVELNFSDGSKHTLYIGNPSSTKQYFYAKVDNKSSIYTINYTIGSLFYMTRDNMKSTYITLGWSGQDFSYVKLERNEKTVYELEQKDGWQMLKPLKTEANSANVSNMLTTLSDCQITSFDKENPSKKELAADGFDDPYYTAILKNSDGDTITLCVADKLDFSSDKACKIWYKELNQLAEAEPRNLSFLESSPASLITSTIENSSVADISEVDVDLDDSYDCDFKATYSYDNDSAMFSNFKLNGKSIDTSDNNISEAALNLIKSTLNISFEDIDSDAKPSGKATEKITFKTKDGDIKYEYIPVSGTDNKFYCMKNGKYTGYIVRRKNFSQETAVVDCYQKLLDATK